MVAESVEETYFVMDSVFLGSAERQVTELHFDDPDLPAIFLGDLLSWVELFATNEGPRLIRDGGKDGVIEAFSKTADKLFRLVEATAELSDDNDDTGLPASFHTARVHRALGELRDQLENVTDLAEQIRREPLSNPVVLLVSPQQSATIDGMGLTVLGSGFQRGMTRHAVKLIFFEDDSVQGLENDTPPVIPSDDVDVRSENGLVAFFNLTDAQPGTYSIEVTNPDGGKGLSEGVFQIIGAGSDGPNGNGGAAAAVKAAKRARSKGPDGNRRGAIARAAIKRRVK